MRILVTGGAGFLGSHLVDRLLDEGHEVIALDNLQTGSRDNVAHVAGHRRFSFVEHDVIRPYEVGPLDRIYNLACAASPPRYQADPIHTTLTSVLGVVHALEYGNEQRARVLQASTSEVYGDPDVHPQPEDYRGNVNPHGPRACYDEGKRCAESLVMDHHRTRGTEVRIARIFNTYGPRMDLDDGRVVSTFIVQALRGVPLTIYGDGSQTRSLCYVDDLIDGLVRLMEHPTETGPINLGNPVELTVRELADRVRELTGSESPLGRRPLPVDDPRQRRPVIDRARRLLGFEPRVALHDGLVRTIEDFRVRLGVTRAA
ncbi:MAG: SDR family oxidoreductase [Deltaproteobacteria bacterium]|nr:SDR family oxidoreductase [Deltaproteobacteria bacterium]